jgi:hypothetical protein
MKIDQVAYYAATEIAADEIKADFGLTNAVWVKDIVTGVSKVAIGATFTSGISQAELSFNYNLGVELEIIRYLSGPHWHQGNVTHAHKFMSHVGCHLEDGEPFPLMPHSRLVQETQTTSHTSDYLTLPDSPGYNRKYHYRIYEMGPGTYVKFIKRINR